MSRTPEDPAGECSRIIELLREEPRGLSTSEISRRLGMNRNSVAKYLNMLVVSGRLDMQEVAVAKVYYLSHRVPISAMLDFSSDLILVLDSAGRVVQANDNFLSFTGLGRGEVAGRDIGSLDIPLLAPLLEAGLMRVALAGKERADEVRFEKDGKDLYFVVKLVPTVFDDGGAGVTVIMEDVTASRQVLQEKERLLAEIHQRVRNNLQLISSLLALQAGSMGEGAGREIIRKTEGRLGVLARAHDHLDRSPDHARVGLGAYLADLLADSAAAADYPADLVATRVVPSDLSLRLDAAIPVGLIVNELVSNACAHACLAGAPGCVLVSALDDGAALTLVVEDEGSGMPAGFDPVTDGSLGLTLVRTLVTEQLGGRMAISGSGPGTRVIVTVPHGGETP
ncbi:MAG: histidine kinase dimerization/phosphoacceptor domain -containing protein [Methanofollis sp.]|uniref:sensor histidine kinase n=1 Tax=Methanofollis sp. TaxID=2052835 RepID=UPI002630CE01|nr:histidine kinase dimerization/phosphoacceptor domain -containing protein [Methanofollis sp.]MDD4254715.1 histidine kinase dimerization/phosphoacceptor domain -containing protein [Methanofollis sp.]